MNDPFELPSLQEIEEMEKQRSQAIVGDSVKCQKCGIADKPSLLLSAEVGSAAISLGNQQKLVVNVLDEKSNEKVNGAKVKGEIVYPSGSHALLEEDTSDNDGRVSYSWKITIILN